MKQHMDARAAGLLGRFAVMDTDGLGSSDDGPEPSAQEARGYVQRMRSLPVEQVLGDVMFSLLNAAQVKLGRRDARLLIDVSTVAHEHARPYLPAELSKQFDQVLGELRLGQVSAEGHVSQQGEPEQNDLDRLPTPPLAGTEQPPADQPPGKPTPASPREQPDDAPQL
jgi:hypothetical protein